MRLGFLAVAFFIACSVTSPAASELSAKKHFTVTSSDSNNTLDGVYVQNGDGKFLVLHLNEDQPNEEAVKEELVGGSEDDAASDSREDRSIGVDVAGKLKKTFSGEYDTVTNKFLWRFFRALVPKERRLPSAPRVPPRMRKTFTSD